MDVSKDVMDVNQNVDVTVVGAGPVGLVLAAELALAGATVQILERRAEPDEAVKAGAINVPAAEALDRRGLLSAAEKVQRETLERVGPFARKVDDQQPGGGRRAREPRFTGHFAGMILDADLVDWSDPDLAAHTAVAGARMVPQWELEKLLADHVARLGIPVRREVEVTALEDTGDGVLVGTTAGTVRTGWLVGCDGGRSTVRRLAGFDFPGTDPELAGLLGIVDIADPEKLVNGWVWSARGAYRYGPQPGRVVTVEADGASAHARLRSRGGTPMAPVTLEELQTTLRRVSGTDVTLTALRGAATRWTDNARQAATYRSGRVLLAGDAAHVHSPFSGQGLNLGIGDATNLGWKLGAVVAGWAPEGLLDTYDAERRPLGARVLDWTRAQTGVMRGDVKSAALREVVSDLLSTREGATYAVKKISGVTQRIDLPGDHPLVGRFVPDLWLTDGSRLVDHGHGGGFLLLDRTADGAFARLAAAWAGRVGSVTDDHATPTGVLVRPDGVVAWASDATVIAAVTGLEAALHRWAGAPSSSPEHEPVS
ncbi:2-polyprenyl-6-methoxyphenol hydroxylase-like FAD-dependent oxidoreductase [Streptomyces griseochromogenes]|uniref:2-polyprenyl-6-methoxyphenol hydroxylase-like FAD-dependent oxidoreductase n=2 Tax=Streptomyces griseochromogenes TaxID=68214 RepID=A0ABS4LR59_9ACTN|nr:FAD-dependent monooxygenase [Streptomyces griseochromogenes]MBP2049882.1 2-polyprenyl-6-methoxyphenol hydroxylase-like FAD-dependent oxidoreductase [Streptomyces griseochromogenes]